MKLEGKKVFNLTIQFWIAYASKKKLEDILKIIVKIRHIKTCEMQPKQCLEEIYSYKYKYWNRGWKSMILASHIARDKKSKR